MSAQPPQTYSAINARGEDVGEKAVLPGYVRDMMGSAQALTVYGPRRVAIPLSDDDFGKEVGEQHVVLLDGNRNLLREMGLVEEDAPYQLFRETEQCRRSRLRVEVPEQAKGVDFFIGKSLAGEGSGLGLFASKALAAGTARHIPYSVSKYVLTKPSDIRQFEAVHGDYAHQYVSGSASGPFVLPYSEYDKRERDQSRYPKKAIPEHISVGGRVNEPPPGVLPNAEYFFNAREGRMMLQLTRDLQAGEEVYACYGPGFARSYDEPDCCQERTG